MTRVTTAVAGPMKFWPVPTHPPGQHRRPARPPARHARIALSRAVNSQTKISGASWTALSCRLEKRRHLTGEKGLSFKELAR